MHAEVSVAIMTSIARLPHNANRL